MSKNSSKSNSSIVSSPFGSYTSFRISKGSNKTLYLIPVTNSLKRTNSTKTKSSIKSSKSTNSSLKRKSSIKSSKSTASLKRKSSIKSSKSTASLKRKSSIKSSKSTNSSLKRLTSMELLLLSEAHTARVKRPVVKKRKKVKASKRIHDWFQKK